VIGRNRDVPCIHKHETPCPIGCLDHARLETGLADQCRLLISCHAKNGDRLSEMLALRVAQRSLAVHNVRHHCEWNIQHTQKLLIPGPAMDIEEHGAAGIGGVGNMRRTTRQAIDQPAIDGAETNLAIGCPGGQIGVVAQGPRYLGRREIGIDDKPCCLTDIGLKTIIPEFLANGFGTPVLPDNCRAAGVASFPVPKDDRFTLIGDPDAGNRGIARIPQHVSPGREYRVPDRLRIVFHPSGMRVALFKRRRCRSRDPSFGVEQERPGARRPLIDRQDMRRL